MSDTENKAESTAKTEAVETAPYMKKDNQNKDEIKSTKSNIIIPLVLLLTSAIVIAATFYGEGYNIILNEADAQKEAATDVIAETAGAETAVAEDDIAQDYPAESIETEKNGTVAKTEATDQDITAQTEATSPADIIVTKASTAETVAAATQAQPENSRALTQRIYATSQYNVYNREQAQVWAKQHMEMLQQRRQAYEREMQDRRARYEAAMKARQEKRANIAKAQKAVLKRAQQNRVETNHKIQEIHNQISKLHEEIHQIMRESRRTAAPVQMQSM